jgi:uncharacterized protein YjbI with pentapeptide repeats
MPQASSSANGRDKSGAADCRRPRGQVRPCGRRASRGRTACERGVFCSRLGSMRWLRSLCRWLDSRPALVLGAVAAGVVFLVGRAIEASMVASLSLGVVTGIGVFLFWSSSEERNKTGELGRSIVTGALVGLALAGAQSSANRHARALDEERQQWADHQSLALTLGIQQDLTGIDLTDRDMAFAYLRARHMPRAQLTRADACRATLHDADLRRANLGVTALRGADLSGANLRQATAWRADLTDAHLFRADLQGALLVDANLTRATLTEADLRGASLEGSDLSGATLKRAKYDSSTVWPRNVDPRRLDATLATQGKVKRPDARFYSGPGGARPRCFSVVWTRYSRP